MVHNQTPSRFTELSDWLARLHRELPSEGKAIYRAAVDELLAEASSSLGLYESTGDECFEQSAHREMRAAAALLSVLR